MVKHKVRVRVVVRDRVRVRYHLLLQWGGENGHVSFLENNLYYNSV